MSEPNAVTYTDALPPDDKANDDDLAALLAKRQHAKPNRMTWALLTLLVLMAGFVGGAAAYAHFGTTSNQSTRTFAGFPGAGAFPGGAGSSAAGGAPAAGGFGNATIGTVKLVDGQNLYLTTTNGETVKVKVPASTPVTAQKDVSLTDLASGSTVIVRGEKASDGTVSATSVSQGGFAGAGQRSSGAASSGAPTSDTNQQPSSLPSSPPSQGAP